MPFASQTQWRDAKQALANAPDGYKLRHLGARHSFIKINGEIYVLNRSRIRKGDSLIGRGTYGRVKYMENEQGQRFVVKIEPDDSFGTEPYVLADLGLSLGKAKRPDKNKYYTHMTDLGQSLAAVLDRQEGTLNIPRRFRLAIDVGRQVHRLHHGLDSRTGTAYAHLDLKITNCTVDNNDRVHLVDMGEARSGIERILDESWGTYLFRPPLNTEMSAKDYDKLALQRIWFMPDDFISADGHSQHARCKSVLTKDMMQRYGLDEFINTSSQHRPTLDSFLDDDSTALSLTAVLIATVYKLSIDRRTLKSNRLLCLVLLSMYDNKATRNDVRDAVNNIDAWLLASVPAETPLAVAKARFFNAQLNLGEQEIDDDKALLINHLEAHDLIGHWKKIRQYSPGQRAFILSASPEFLKALKLLLNETSLEQPLPQDSANEVITQKLEEISDESVFQSKCLQELFAHPSLATCVSTKMVRAWRMRQQHTLIDFSADPQLAIRIPFDTLLEDHDLTWYREQIMQLPGLYEFIQSPYVTPDFLTALWGKLSCGGKEGMEYYRVNMPIIDVLTRRRNSTLPAYLSTEQKTAVLHCDKLILTNVEFNRCMKVVLMRSANGSHSGAIAINALVDAGVSDLKPWLMRLDALSQDAVSINVEAICQLAEQGANAERYETVFRTLSSIDSPSREDVQALIAAPAVLIQPDVMQNTQFRRQLLLLRHAAKTQEEHKSSSRLCKHLDRLRTKQYEFRAGSDPHVQLTNFIVRVQNSIERRFGTDRPDFQTQYAGLHQDVQAHLRLARPVLAKHRGILGWLDSFLAVLTCCFRSSQGVDSPYTFFQTKTDKLLTRFENSMSTVPGIAG